MSTILKKVKDLIKQHRVDEARDLLLDEAYVLRLDSKLQKAYLELIPVNPTLKAMLKTEYAGLKSKDAKDRFAASTKIARELEKSKLRDKRLWMRDPRAVDPILKACEDKDPKVADRVFLALYHLITGYFADLRALPLAMEKLKHRDAKERLSAICILSSFSQESILAHLIELFDKGETEDRRNIAAVIWGHSMDPEELKALRFYMPTIQWSAAGRKFWREKMISALKDPDSKVRQDAAQALENLGDKSSLKNLKSAASIESDENARYCLEKAVAAIQKRQGLS